MGFVCIQDNFYLHISITSWVCRMTTEVITVQMYADLIKASVARKTHLEICTNASQKSDLINCITIFTDEAIIDYQNI